MPFEIENHEKYLLLRLHPSLTGEDLPRALAEMAQLDARMPAPPKHRITDLSLLDEIDIGFPEIEMVAKGRRELKLSAPMRSALVAPSPLQFGFARMFQTLNDNPKVDVRIMRTMEEALRWIESD